MSADLRARVWRWVAVVVLAALGVTALIGGSHDITQGHSAGQHVQAIAQLTYSTAAVVAALALALGWAVARLAYAVFVVAVTIAAALAPVVWGEQSWWTGAAAAIATLVVCWLIWLAFRRGLRRTAATQS